MTTGLYIQEVLNEFKKRNPFSPDLLQTVKSFLTAVQPVLDRHPEYIQAGILKRLIEPERLIQFRVPWTDDTGNVHVNRAFRVQYNSALGPYKGGLRFHPSVNADIIQFLGFEQTLKNSLTNLPLGGGKGGSDFDPKGKSEHEIMRFCQSLMIELQRYIGPDTDVPAGDIGVGAREIGYLFGQYKRLNGFQNGALTGKPLLYGGSLGRKEATGYGLLYFTQAMLKEKGDTLEGKRVMISGSGNVAIYAIEKAQELGAVVIGCSDSAGYILDEAGVNLDTIKQLKEMSRKRISEYVLHHPKAAYTEGSIWNAALSYDIALPCATQNEIDGQMTEQLLKNGVQIICEGANMPANTEAVALFKKAGVLYAPSKAANAGGVVVSALEMSQNSLRLKWTTEEVDSRLQAIMQDIYETVSKTAKEYGQPGDLEAGANMAGFLNVAEAMLSQGIV